MLNSYGAKPKPQRAHATIAAARAEEMTAKASIATADAIKKNSRYLLAAVIVARHLRRQSKLVTLIGTS
jgi:hypothetical protein